MRDSGAARGEDGEGGGEIGGRAKRRGRHFKCWRSNGHLRRRVFY